MSAPGSVHHNPPPVCFTLADAERAYDAWGCNCGPGALAALTGLTLEQVRPHIPDFPAKGYTNPTMMFDALDSIGVRWKCTVLGKRVPMVEWPALGLARVQWEGPWTAPGVPMAARYRHTHWVGACRRGERLGIFDINCLNNGSGWVGIDEWRTVLVPWLLRECHPRASGTWHLTHAIELGAHV
jgi:hypothetical protein